MLDDEHRVTFVGEVVQDFEQLLESPRVTPDELRTAYQRLETHGLPVPAGGLFMVQFAYGRRGSTLNTGSKTPGPVDESKAKEIFDKLSRVIRAVG